MIQYQMIFLGNFLLVLLMMKFISWTVTETTQRGPLLSFLFMTPYLSVRSTCYQSPLRPYSILASFLLHSVMMGLFLVMAAEFLSPFSFGDILLISPAIYFLTEAVGAVGQLLFIRNRPAVFPIHHRPLTSPSLSQFWGRRWNLWVQDWLKDISAALGRRPRAIQILMTFLISGFFHEVMINFPYWIVTGKSYFGTMMLYFLIQALGLYGDKKFIKHSHPKIRRVYLWLFVIVPSPLFINQPLLTFFGLTNSFN